MTTNQNSEHTPEPWSYIGEEDGDFVISGPADEFVANIGEPVVPVGHVFDIDRANARRIVACVNAAANISTDDLEELVGSGFVELQKHTLRKLEGEIDALQLRVTSLEGALSSVSQLAREATVYHPEAAAILIKLAQMCDATLSPSGPQEA